MTVSCSSVRVAYALVLLINIIILCVNGAPDIRFRDEYEVRPEETMKEELRRMQEEPQLYQKIIHNFLKPVEDIKKLENDVNKLSSSATANHKIISELKEKLNADRRNMNASLQRQENELAKLEPQVGGLQENWMNQTTELEQLKQLWENLSKKVKADTSAVQNLRVAGQDFDRHLGEQKRKMQQQETAAERLQTSLQEVEESMMDMKKDLEEAFNGQERLEMQLEDLRSELKKLAAGEGKVSVASSDGHRTADAACRRLGLA